jgi:hypothetical protein
MPAIGDNLGDRTLSPQAPISQSSQTPWCLARLRKGCPHQAVIHLARPFTILQVWARAREQEAPTSVEDAGGALGPVMLGGPSMSGPSLNLSMSNMSLSSVDLWEGEGLGEGPGSALDLASLLLGPENAPLRRVLMEVNPAATVAAMRPEMRATVRQLAVDVLSPLPLVQLMSWGASRGRMAQRAQRKRLAMLARAQAARVACSPLAAVLQLVAFTAQVVAAVIAIKLRLAWAWLLERVRQLLGSGGRRGEAGAARHQPASTFA